MASEEPAAGLDGHIGTLGSCLSPAESEDEAHEMLRGVAQAVHNRQDRMRQGRVAEAA
jgi:hypothetical protein